MRRILVLSSFAAVAALFATAPATAKGPTAASLSGPGLSHALPVKGEGEGGLGSPLGSLVELGGFFPQVFAQTPDPTITTRSTAGLGPRYRVVYRVPGGSENSTIVQDVYPYAKPQPVTHMRAGQPFWDGAHTHGGWFVSNPGLKATLVKVGLPESPPAAASASFPWSWTVGGAAAFAFLLLLALRRRGSARLRALGTSA